MKLAALLLLGLAATASANKCGWAKPSDILTKDSINLHKLTNPDGPGSAGDALGVSFKFNYDIYQYRIERVSKNGRYTIIPFEDGGYFNADHTTANQIKVASSNNDISPTSYDASVSTPKAAKRMLIDMYVAHAGDQSAFPNWNTHNMSEVFDHQYGDSSTASEKIGHHGFDHATAQTSTTIKGNRTSAEDIDAQYVRAQAAPGTQNIFDTDNSMILSKTSQLTTDVMYIVSVRSLRCGRNFYNETHPDRGVLLKGIFKLTVNFDVVVTDHAVIGTTSMGMDDPWNTNGGLIFVKHADEIVAEYTQSLSMETFVHDISIDGSITLTGDEARECAGESSAGFDDGITTYSGKQSNASFDFRTEELCRITGLVTAVHIDSDRPASDGGSNITGNGNEEFNGNDDFVSVDSEKITDDMTGYRHRHNLYDSQIVTFLSMAQYTMTGDVPTCTSMLTTQNLADGKFSPTWFQTPLGNTGVDSNGNYECDPSKTHGTFNRTSWTGGACAANDPATGCNDIPYIIARHGNKAGHDDLTMKQIGTSATDTTNQDKSDREGCTINEALQSLLNSDNTAAANLYDATSGIFEYNFTCTSGYTQADAVTPCNYTASGIDNHTNGCDRHFTQVVYTPFFGFDGDDAFSPLQYTRMWYGRTTDNYIIQGETEASSLTPSKNEFDAVDANSTQSGEHKDHSRRLRGVEKVRKLLKATPPTVNEMYQHTFHFKVRAPPGKLRHRHRHH